MNKIIYRLAILVCCIFSSTILVAQNKEELNDIMRSSGKIYVVVAVCLTILIGLFIYVFLIDRKISKIEKEN
jgi:NADH:ubiquinone oxidoreductase subunit 6 (subunit J)